MPVKSSHPRPDRRTAAVHPGLLVILLFGITAIVFFLLVIFGTENPILPTDRPTRYEPERKILPVIAGDHPYAPDEEQPERKPIVTLTDLSPKGDLSMRGQVLDETGLPVEGVLIKTRPTYSKASFAHVKTDENGYFCFNGLEEKFYEIVSDSDIGFLKEASSNMFGSSRNWRKPLNYLKAGDKDAVFKLTRYGRITGSFVNEAGVPVPSFTARAEEDCGEGKTEDLSFKNGLFDIRRIKPGRVFVVAHGRWDTLSDVMEIKPGQTIQDLTLVEKERGGVSGVVLAQGTLEPMPGFNVRAFNTDRRLYLKQDTSSVQTEQDGSFTIGNLAPGSARLSVLHNDRNLAWVEDIEVEGGKITEGIVIKISKCRSGIEGMAVANGLPLSDIEVDISVNIGEHRSEWSCVTDVGGKYQFLNIPSGTYSLSTALPLGTKDETNLYLTVDVREGEIVHQDIIFETRVLKGRVLISGVPISGVNISVRLKNDFTVCNAETETDDNGFYQISNLVQGEYAVYAGVSYEGASYGSRQDVTLTESATVCNFSFGDRGSGEVYGRITKNNRPVRAADIDLTHDAFSLHVTSDSDGYYRFTKVAPGAIRLQVGLAQGNYTNGLVQEKRLTMESGGAIEQNFDFRTGTGVLSGSVTLDNKPLEDGLVLLRMQTDNEITATDIQEMLDNGKFRVQGLLAGRYYVRIMGPAGSRFSTVDIQEGKEVILDVAFDTGNAIIEGMVKMPGEEESPNVFVFLYPNGANLWQTGDHIEPAEAMESRISIGKADEEGCFTMEEVPAGSYKVVALHLNADKEVIVLATNHVESSGKEGEVVNVQLTD